MTAGSSAIHQSVSNKIMLVVSVTIQGRNEDAIARTRPMIPRVVPASSLESMDFMCGNREYTIDSRLKVVFLNNY